MKKNNTYTIAFLGVMSALLIVAFTLETFIGSLWITPPAIVSLTIVFVICFSYDWKIGLYCGILFGVSSFVIAWIIGNPLFILPWISILPRLFVGIGAYGIYRLIKQLTAKSNNKFLKDYLPYGVGAFFGVIINTFLVLLCLTFFAPSAYSNTFVGWFKLVITINFPIELGVSTVLVPILMQVVNKIKSKRVEE